MRHHEPRSLFRLLQDGEDLHVAVEHALQYDRDEIARVQARISHYEAMDSPVLVLVEPAERTSPDEEEPERY